MQLHFFCHFGAFMSYHKRAEIAHICCLLLLAVAMCETSPFQDDITQIRKADKDLLFVCNDLLLPLRECVATGDTSNPFDLFQLGNRATLPDFNDS